MTFNEDTYHFASNNEQGISYSGVMQNSLNGWYDWFYNTSGNYQQTPEEFEKKFYSKKEIAADKQEFLQQVAIGVALGSSEKIGNVTTIRVNALSKSKYSSLKDSKSVGAGKKFTSAQKKNILEQNKTANGGVKEVIKVDRYLITCTS